MPRLPDYTDLGQRPVGNVVRASRNVPSVDVKAAVAPGQAVAGFADVLNEVDAEMARIDNLRAEEAFNKLREKQIDLTVGDDGFTKKKGGDVVNSDVFKEFGERFSQESKQIGSDLKNDRQREFFKKRSAIADMEFKQNILNHVTREKDAYAKSVFESTIKLETGSAIDNHMSTAAIALSMERMNAAISKEADRNKWSPEQTQLVRQQAQSNVNAGIINRMLANDNDLSATAFYEKNGNQIIGEDKINVEKALAVGSTRGESQRQSDYLLSKHNNNFGLAMEDAKKIKNSRVREATLGVLRQADADYDRKKKSDKDQVSTTALEYVQKNRDVNTIPPDVWVQLSDDDHKTLRKIASGETATVNDDKMWNDFNSKATDRKWLTGMNDLEFGKYLLSFDEPHQERASALRDAAREAAKGDKKASEFLRNDATLRQLVLGRVIDAGLIDAKKKTADYSQEDETILNNTVAEASAQLEAFQVKNKRKATVEEERAVVNGLLMKHVKVKVEKPWYLPDSTKKVSELTSDEIEKAYVPYKSVPVGSRDALRKMGTELGIKSEDISEDRISKAYTVFMLTKTLPRADREARIAAILRGQ